MSTVNKRKILASSALWATLLAPTATALAAKSGETLVIGTRKKERSVSDATVPVDIIPAEELNSVGGDANTVESLQALVPSFTAAPEQGDGSAFVRAVSMRGMAADQTLVLVNGKRRHRSAMVQLFSPPSSQGAHAPDISHIPAIALKNVEVLRDGAAAQYGSDAIAGVINFNLKNADSGRTVAVTYGQHLEGEKNWKIATNVGTKFCGDGFLNLSAETNHMDHLSRGEQHQRAQALIDAGVEGVGSDALNDDGHVQTWGRPENKGSRFVVNTGCKLGKTKLYTFANYGNKTGLWSFFYRHPSAGATGANLAGGVYPNNLGGDDGHAALQGQYVQNATNIDKEKRAGFTPQLEGIQEDYNVVVGLKGERFLGMDINYDLSMTKGYNKMDYTLKNSLNPQIPVGVSCDHDLATGTGDVACAGADGPIDLTAVRDFDTTDLKQEETLFNLDLSQELSSRSLLTYGLEYRKEEFTQYPGDWPARYGAGVSGMAGQKLADAGTNDRSTYALYADLEHDMSEALLLQGASRFESSDFGSSVTGKIAGRLKLSDRLALRGAFSTGFKAPTAAQSNYRSTTTTFDGAGQEIRNSRVPPTSPAAMAAGGKELTEEKSSNINAGFIYHLSRNSNLTFDIYSITLSDRIASAASQGTFTGTPPVRTDTTFYTNALDTKHTGFDLVWTGRVMRNTMLTFAWNHNKASVEKNKEVNGSQVVSDDWINSIEKAMPQQRFTLTSHTMFGDRMGLMGRVRYFGAHHDTHGTNGTILEGNEPHAEIEATYYLDLEFTYKYSKGLNLVFGGMNLLDTYPTETLAENNVQNYNTHGFKYGRFSAADYQGGSWYIKGVYTF